MSHTDPQPTLTPKAAPQEEESLEGLPFGEATRRKPHSGEVDTPLCVYGSKRVHIDKLLAIVPKHSFYTEPFAGAAALFFAKPGARVGSALNDLNGEIFNLFRVLQNQGEALQRKWSSTTYSEDVYKYAKFIAQHPHLFDDLTRAWATLAGMHMAASPLMWGTGCDRQRTEHDGRITGHVHRLYSLRGVITQEAIDKLRRVELQCMDAFEFIARYNYDNGFCFLDPPYAVKGRKVHMGHYKHSFSPDDLLRLARLLPTLRGKWLLTCYDTEGLMPVLQEGGWHVWRVLRQSRHQKAQGYTLEELFVANYDISALAAHGGKPIFTPEDTTATSKT
nr:MAG TPA: DNA adenine methylase [Caudoviricetes sp.]